MMEHQHKATGQRRTNLGQQGLTLLEVLITLGILAVMAVIALEAFRLGHRTWEQGERHAEAAQRIRAISGLLTHELASLQPVTAELNGRRVKAFKGSPQRLLFYSAPNRYSAIPYAGMVRGLSFFVEKGKGLMVQESHPLVEGQVSLNPGGVIKVVDPHVTKIRFRYLVPPSGGGNEPRWVEVWDPFELSEKTVRSTLGRRRLQRGRNVSQVVESSFLPLAVESIVTVGDDRGEKEHNFLFPVHVGHYFF